MVAAGQREKPAAETAEKQVYAYRRALKKMDTKTIWKEAEEGMVCSV